MRFNLAHLLVLLDATSLLVFGHPGWEEDHEHPDSLSHAQKRELLMEAEERNIALRSCQAEIDAFMNERKVKREEIAMKKKRALGVTGYTTGFSTATLSATTPMITAINNTACVLAPDVTEGPYYLQNEFVRDDLREWQPGVELELDIGVVDTSNCKPVPQAFVELWGTNATGQYTGFAKDNAPGGPGAPAPGQTPRVSDGDTSLRGGYPTNANGVVGIKTIYPGFYTGRTVHVHVMIHTGWKTSTNGTLVSKGGTVRHMGQIFFDDTWTDRVVNTTVYRRNTFNTRMRNAADFIVRQAGAGGYNTFAALTMKGTKVEDGILGYITIGINSRKSLTIQSPNFNGVLPRPNPPANP